MNFTKIIITNVATQTVVHTFDFTLENEKLADMIAREHNTNAPMLGLLSVHYK